jgi:uncharacterized peroxidase-related enzyme
MSRLPTIDPATASGAAGELLARTNRALGLIPNMTKVMANSPALLKGYLDLSGALAHGTLDAGVRERIAVAVAEYNGCTYCLSAHTYLGQHVASVPAAELTLAREARSSDPNTQAILTLADAIVRTSGNVDDEAIAAARAAGVTDTEIAETVGNVAINVLTNYLNNLSQVEVDWPALTPRSRAA